MRNRNESDRGGRNKKPYSDSKKPYKPAGKDNNRFGSNKKTYGGNNDDRPKPQNKRSFDQNADEGRSNEKRPFNKPFAKKPFQSDNRDRNRFDDNKKSYSRNNDDRSKPQSRRSFDNNPEEGRSNEKRPFNKPSAKKPFQSDDRDRNRFDGRNKRPVGRDAGPAKPHNRRSFDKEVEEGAFDEKKAFKKPYPNKRDGDFRNKEKKEGSGYKKSFDDKTRNERGVYKRHKKEEKSDWPMRLNRYVSQSGICSRREADIQIAHGLVKVNGQVITEMGYKVKENDEVKYDGGRIFPENKVYLLLNKPKDYITTTDDDRGRKTVMDLVAGVTRERMYPVGRLDRNTTGVLLLTNDGDLAQKLTHPAFEITKLYHVTLDRKPAKEDLDKLLDGVQLEDGIAHVDNLVYLDQDDKKHIGVTLHSGKNRIVRRIFEAVGYEVEKLDRIGLGPFDTKRLKRGEYRMLKPREIEGLLKAKRKI